MTQVTLTNLQFESMNDGTVYGPCASFVPEKQPSGRRLAHVSGRGFCKHDFGGTAHPCLTPDYPECRGFREGVRWGQCWSACTSEVNPNLWLELSVWGDSIAIELAWDADFSLAAGCSGAITMRIGEHSSTAALASGTGGGRVSLALTADGSSLAAAQASTHPVEVTSAAGQVLSRAATHDVFIEVPRNTPRCGYDLRCANVPLMLVDMMATNPHPTDFQTARISFSRNFETRVAGLPQSGTGAEITGLNAQIWEASSLQPTGIATQISKNWHTGSTDAYWAGFDGPPVARPNPNPTDPNPTDPNPNPTNPNPTYPNPTDPNPTDPNPNPSRLLVDRKRATAAAAKLEHRG